MFQIYSRVNGVWERDIHCRTSISSRWSTMELRAVAALHVALGTLCALAAGAATAYAYVSYIKCNCLAHPIFTLDALMFLILYA